MTTGATSSGSTAAGAEAAGLLSDPEAVAVGARRWRRRAAAGEHEGAKRGAVVRAEVEWKVPERARREPREARRPLPVVSTSYAVPRLAYGPPEGLVGRSIQQARGRTWYEVLVPSTAVCTSGRDLARNSGSSMPLSVRSTWYSQLGVVVQTTMSSRW